MQSHDKRIVCPDSTTNFLCDVWQVQPQGWVFLRAVKDGKRASHELRSDNARHIRKLVDKYSGWDLWFCPHTFSEPIRSKRHALPSRWLWAWCINTDFGYGWPEPDYLYEAGDFDLGLWKLESALSPDDIEMRCRNLAPIIGTGKSIIPKLTTLIQCPHDVSARGIIKRYGVPVKRYMRPVAKGHRSSVMFHIATACLKRGVPFDQVRIVVEASEAFKVKRAEQGSRWGEAELKRLPENALRYLRRQAASSQSLSERGGA